ncbi:MAG: hypothetical protein KR126chlam1_01030, partial [Chlamydiae bacterium]|nr:hypothetical protein [Chlamydiota bacterium]
MSVSDVSSGQMICKGSHSPKTPNKHTIQCLPEEVLLQIFSLLSEEERAPLSGTCRDFRRIASDWTFWKIFAKSVGISHNMVEAEEIPDRVRNELFARIDSTKGLPEKEELIEQIGKSESIHYLAQIVKYRDTFVVYSALA